MRKQKQDIVLSILDTGIYKVDTEKAIVYAFRKRGVIELKTNLLPTGYRQITLFKGRGTGIKAIVYLHQLVYLAHYGFYPDGWEVDHIDRDKDNCAHWNLEVKTSKGNSQNKAKSKYPNTLKCIRSQDIKIIRRLHSEGISQASIARKLYLNRLSVRYIIKRIDAVFPLKYEYVECKRRANRSI